MIVALDSIIENFAHVLLEEGELGFLTPSSMNTYLFCILSMENEATSRSLF